jgi:hypothetical protein
MKLFLWPAKRQRKERIRAAVQHTAGMRAVRRIAMVCRSMLRAKWYCCIYCYRDTQTMVGGQRRGDVNKR